MDDILITDKKVTIEQLKLLCERWFGDMVKVVVDVQKEMLGIGGDLHADAEAMLMERGSNQKDLWGANVYPWHEPEERIEFTALINIRPKQDNHSIEIEDDEMRSQVRDIIEKLIIGQDEKLV